MTETKSARNKEIIKLREKGYTYETIAKALGISRQRVQQICHRELDKNKKG